MILWFSLALGLARGTPPDPRASILQALAAVKDDEPIDHLYDLLNPPHLDDTLWRWAMTDEIPRVRARATQLLGHTAYTPARFTRLVSEMERAIVAANPRAYDFMIAVALMRAESEGAAVQMRERVRRGVPPTLRAHYYRARVEYDLVPPGRESEAVAAALTGPSAEARRLAFRDAVHGISATDSAAPAELVGAMEHHLMTAGREDLFAALRLIRAAPRADLALVPGLRTLYVDHPARDVRKLVAGTLYRLRGGGPLRNGRRNFGPLTDGARDFIARACERLLYRP